MKYREEFIFEDERYSVYFKVDCDDSNVKKQIVSVAVKTFAKDLLSNGDKAFLIREFRYGQLTKQIGKHDVMAPHGKFKYKVAVDFTSDDISGIVILCSHSKEIVMSVFNDFKDNHTKLFDEDDNLHSLCVEYLEDGVSKMMLGQKR